MAHQNTVFRGPETQEAFYADKVRVWEGVNKGMIATIIFLVLLLTAMAVFL
jgi:hypothetical protein